MLLSELFETFIRNEVICGGLAERTQHTYRHTAKLVVEYLGDVDVSLILLDDVRSFYLHLLGYQKPNTARLHILQFRAVLRFAVRRNWSNVLIDEIRAPKRLKQQIKYLTPTEIEEFIELADTPSRGYPEINRLRNIAILRVLWASGIRVGELCRLNRDSIRDRQFVVVGKSKNPRPCFITTEALLAVDEYLSVRTDNHPALFIANETKDRVKPDGVRRIFSRICSQSDFEGITPHTFRHSFATFMLSRGVDIRLIAAMMGHESLDTTRIYTHYTNPQLWKTYENAQKK